MTTRSEGSTAPAYALLADGTMIEIRQAGPPDLAAVRGLHRGISPDSAYLRFFSISPTAADAVADRICREPDDEHAALLAVLGGEVVGVASYEPTGEAGVAEIAFVVADHMHRRGVATLLLEHLVSVAERRGVGAFRAETLSQNYDMLRVFADAGLAIERHLANGVVEMTIPLAETGRYLDAVAERERLADVASLGRVLRPRSVAVVGASRRRGSVGRAVLHNVRSYGFAGTLVAVNPHARSVEGIACYPSVADLPEAPDLAVVTVPAAAVLDVARQCGRRGAGALLVITSGLDRAAGAALLDICRRHGMRLVGPNCFGVANTDPEIRLDATFAARHPEPGRAGLVVQSGGVGIALLEHLARLRVGVSSFASVGDKYDISSNDLLMWWEADPGTELVILYVESFGNPRKFSRTARRLGRSKPVLTVLAGRSEAGQQAAASHTAAAATPAATQEALFAQAGIVAARGLGELLDVAALLAHQPVPAGRRVAIVSNAGGAGVLAADACADAGLAVPALGERTRRVLGDLLPHGAVVTNPVDATAGVAAERFRRCVEAVAADPEVDAVVALVVPTAVGDLSPALRDGLDGKPLAAVVLDQAEHVAVPAGSRVPSYGSPERAVRALALAAGYQRWRDRPQGRVPDLPGIDEDSGCALVRRFLDGRPDGGWLPFPETMEVLARYGIPAARWRWVCDERAADSAAAELGGRVALKAQAAGVVHKTEAGAVELDLRPGEDVRSAYRRLASRFGGRLDGVVVQAMAPGGVEVLVGATQEPVFGPLVVFGVGGVATDVLGDTAARLTPLTDADAADLVRSVRSAPLLMGYRGGPAVDLAALEGVVLRIARLADDLPEVAELDLNPVIARPGGVMVVDARVRVVPRDARDPFLRRLR